MPLQDIIQYLEVLLDGQSRVLLPTPRIHKRIRQRLITVDVLASALGSVALKPGAMDIPVDQRASVREEDLYKSDGPHEAPEH